MLLNGYIRFRFEFVVAFLAVLIIFFVFGVVCLVCYEQEFIPFQFCLSFDIEYFLCHSHKSAIHLILTFAQIPKPCINASHTEKTNVFR